MPPFIHRVVLRNYRSIGQCDVRMGPLTYLVGANGAGKSNFVDALHLVSDALSSSLEQALMRRGGLSEVRRRSIDPPTSFGIRLEFTLDGKAGHYAFTVGSHGDRGFEVQREECRVSDATAAAFYAVERGEVRASSESTLPAMTSDRLALVALSGLSVFRPIFDALRGMGFYNLNPRSMRDLHAVQEGRLLKSEGQNIASVIGHLERVNPRALSLIEEYLRAVVPTVHGVRRLAVGSMETLEFQQQLAAQDSWRFAARSMSDGTLRALGVLTALFQSNADFSPSLIAIEEPEAALHPEAGAALREALERASKEVQIIITSHSPELLDDVSVEHHQLLAVTAMSGETQLASIDSASRDAIQGKSFSAGELLKKGQLIPDAESLRFQALHQISLFGGEVD